MLYFPFFVVPTSPTSTRPLPLRLMTSPWATVVLLLHPSLQFTLTAPALMRSAILLRLIRNPALPTASNRKDASMDVNVSNWQGRVAKAS